MYLVLGLASEAGEVAGKFKKQLRDNNALYHASSFQKAVMSELGDCLWYIAELATHYNIGLSDIAKDNISKLLQRQQDGTLNGSGDNR